MVNRLKKETRRTEHEIGHHKHKRECGKALNPYLIRMRSTITRQGFDIILSPLCKEQIDH